MSRRSKQARDAEVSTIGNGESEVRVRKWLAGALSVTLALGITAVLVSRARSDRSAPANIGRASWGAKSVTLEEIPERAHFRPLFPTRLPPDIRLAAAQMVWVEQDPFDVRLHPRQAIRLLYRGRDRERQFSVTQAEHVARVEARDNIWQPLSQGYFELDQGMHSLLSVGTRSNVDFVIVSYGLTRQELQATKRSLGPTPPARASGIGNRE